MFPCVALQERMWKGESIEISKCRRLVGSFSSVFDRRITIYSVSRDPILAIGQEHTLIQ